MKKYRLIALVTGSWEDTYEGFAEDEEDAKDRFLSVDPSMKLIEELQEFQTEDASSIILVEEIPE